MRSDRNTPVAVVNHSPGYACGMQVVCTGGRRDIFNVPLRFGEVIGHVTTATTGVRSFGNAV